MTYDPIFGGRRPSNWLQLFAGPSDDGGNSGDQGPNQSGGNDPNAGGGSGGRTFTQEELDRIISERLKRARKQWEDEAAQAAKQAQMTEVEKLKAEKEAAEKKVAEVQTAAERRVIQAEAKVIAAGLGVKQERIAYLLKLVDLSDVTVDDNGEPDTKAIKDAIEQVLKDLPELKGGTGAGSSGAEFSGNNQPVDNPWHPDTLNLTKQGEILRTNPELAKQLIAAAAKAKKR